MTKSNYRRVLLLAFSIGVTACDGRSPSGPTPLPRAAPSAPTVTPSTDAVEAGGRMSVSWTAPRAQPRDWLALFRVGESYDDDWWDYTDGATSGTRTLTAPTRPGQYEFRYLVNDGFRALAHSSPVTVR